MENDIFFLRLLPTSSEDLKSLISEVLISAISEECTSLKLEYWKLLSKLLLKVRWLFWSLDEDFEYWGGDGLRKPPDSDAKERIIGEWDGSGTGKGYRTDCRTDGDGFTDVDIELFD